VKSLFDIGTKIARAAGEMTDTKVDHHIVGSAWPTHFNPVVAEAMQKNIERVGMPVWSEDDRTLARALQAEIGAKVEGLRDKVLPLETTRPTPHPGSDDIGDISWVVPTIYQRFPANIPNLPGHNWANGVSMATPIAHKGSTAGAKAQALTALDFLLRPDQVAKAWDYLRNVQTKEVKYAPLMGPADLPPVLVNRVKMDRFRPQLAKRYYDPKRFRTYMEQLGIRYPTVRAQATR
jgi:aminobenzoyl-glutamate utilization protein B